MPSDQAIAQPASAASWWHSPWLAALVLVVAGWLAYADSLHGPFIFDDLPAIPENPTISHLWPLSGPLSPPANGATVTGRPLLNLSLALNHTIGGYNVVGYHAFNIAVHLLAGLALFGIAWRTFRRPVLRARFGAAALPLGLVVALCWELHPLQTEAVTYLIQRAESLMGLFYLTTLYCWLRGMEADEARAGEAAAGDQSASGSWLPPGVWYALGILACLAGMACKEVMVSAPLMAFLYDRTFVAGSFAQAWRRRWKWYLGLAATWLLLGWLVLSTGNRGASAGFGAGVETYWLGYALAQFPAMVHYLWLTIWPHPLVLDYGRALVLDPVRIGWTAALVLALGLGSLWALWRRPVLGFFGFWFFAILAPSSSVVPVATQAMAEHRMYLSLAAPVALAVAGCYACWGRRALPGLFAVALALLLLTAQRNAVYGTGVSIWRDAAIQQPDNARAHENYGIVLTQAGRLPESVVQYQIALRVQPYYPDCESNFGNALALLGRGAEALPHYERAALQLPDLPAAQYNYANALAGAGQYAAAAVRYRAALRVAPGMAMAHNNLGNVLTSLKQNQAAADEYLAALRADPNFSESYYNLGNLLQAAHQPDKAVGYYEKAIAVKPDYVQAYNGLGNVYLTLGRPGDALAAYQRALALQPDYVEACNNAGSALLQLGRKQEAVAQFEEAARLAPDNTIIRQNLESARQQAGEAAGTGP
jgi:protein O-mannosyl-transferase